MTEVIANMVTIVFLLLTAIFIIYRISKRDYNQPEEVESDPYAIDYLVDGVKQKYDEIVHKKISDLNLNKSESEKREDSKRLVTRALRSCNHGDIGAKEYVIDCNKDILQKNFNVNEETINNIIPFGSERLSIQDKFEIVLHQYKKNYKYDALTKLVSNYKLAELKQQGEEEFYEISQADIERIYEAEKENLKLDFLDKLDIVARRVYQLHKGLSVVDEIRDMNIDGLSGGVSGVPYEFYSYDMEWLETVRRENLNSFDSVWIFFQGKTVRLSFLTFGSQKELVRACKNVYRYGNPGQLSESRGYILNETKDGARVITFRPPFSASWAFFIRKYSSVEKKDLDTLLIDNGKEDVILLLNALIKAKMVLIVTGEMGSGKTTLLMALIGLLKETSRIRVYEQVFELYINKFFPKKNVLSLRKLESIETADALNIIKKTDGNETIMGEIASHEEANWLMEIAQVNPETTLATGHMDSTDEAINYFTDAKLNVGKFNDAKRAEKKVVEFLNIDIHMVNKNGHRYIERITEVVPLEEEDYPEKLADSIREYFRKVTNYKTYQTVDIMRYEDGKYVIKNRPSKRAMEKIIENLKVQERSEFEELFSSVEGGINNE